MYVLLFFAFTSLYVNATFCFLLSGRIGPRLLRFLWRTLRSLHLSMRNFSRRLPNCLLLITLGIYLISLVSRLVFGLPFDHCYLFSLFVPYYQAKWAAFQVWRHKISSKHHAHWTKKTNRSKPLIPWQACIPSLQKFTSSDLDKPEVVCASSSINLCMYIVIHSLTDRVKNCFPLHH